MNEEELFLNYHKLPKPLNEEEIHELIKKVKQGDEEAKSKLVEHNIRLVVYEINKHFYSVEYDKQDLLSIGIVGLMKAILTFDETRKLKFSTYAARCIDNEILMLVRKLKKINNIESIDELLFTDKDNEDITIKDVISDDTDIVQEYINDETKKTIQEIINTLQPQEKELIILHFGFYGNKVHSQREIANILNTNKANISRKIQKILIKIKTQLEEKGIIEINNNKQKEKIKMPRKIQTIYEHFNMYTKEEIDTAIEKLTPEEKDLLKIRYGNDLSNPTPQILNKNERQKFYYSLIPKLKKLLANPNKEIKSRKKKNIDKNNKEEDTKIVNNDIKNENHESQMTMDDYIKILELLQKPYFKEIMHKYSIKETVIISLKLGYINNKYFSTKAISEFLGIEEQEIIDTTKKFLLEYKEKLNEIIDNMIQITENKNDIITKKLNK